MTYIKHRRGMQRCFTTPTTYPALGYIPNATRKHSPQRAAFERAGHASSIVGWRRPVGQSTKFRTRYKRRGGHTMPSAIGEDLVAESTKFLPRHKEGGGRTTNYKNALQEGRWPFNTQTKPYMMFHDVPRFPRRTTDAT